MRFSCSPQRPDWLPPPPQSPIQIAPAALSSGGKQLGCEADRLTPSSVEVKNGGNIMQLPHKFSWRSVYLIKLMKNINFNFSNISNKPKNKRMGKPAFEIVGAAYVYNR
jgi:hypothetical protein